MASRKKKRRSRRSQAHTTKRKVVDRAGPGRWSTISLIRRALGSYWRGLPRIAAVALAGALPMQLLVAWIIEAQEITDAFWQYQYQGLADLLLGTLIVTAVYTAIHDSIEGTSPKSCVQAIGQAYLKGLKAWTGMFITRFMVSIVVGLVALPVLAGVWVVSQAFPQVAQQLAAAENPEAIDVGALWPLVLVTPLFIPVLAIFLRYVLTEPLVALRRIDGFEALEASKALTKGVRLRVLAGMLVLTLPVDVIFLLVSTSTSLLGPWVAAVLTACTMVLAAISGTFLVHVFIEQGGPEVIPRRDEERLNP